MRMNIFAKAIVEAATGQKITAAAPEVGNTIRRRNVPFDRELVTSVINGKSFLTESERAELKSNGQIQANCIAFVEAHGDDKVNSEFSRRSDTAARDLARGNPVAVVTKSAVREEFAACRATAKQAALAPATANMEIVRRAYTRLADYLDETAATAGDKLSGRLLKILVPEANAAAEAFKAQARHIRRSTEKLVPHPYFNAEKALDFVGITI